MKAFWRRSAIFWIGLTILALCVGGPMIVYALAGGGEMGVEGVAMTGLLPVMFIGFWGGAGIKVLGAVVWFTLWRESTRS